MCESAIEELADMVVGERVEDLLTNPAALDELRAPQEAELLRNSRHRKPNQLRQLRHGSLLRHELDQQPETADVAGCAKQLGAPHENELDGAKRRRPLHVRARLLQ
jgi:hypothetical protein